MNTLDALNGALVADAACLGLHWLYDQNRIASIADHSDILFRTPDATDYEDTKGYFAHANKSSGELSHYGEAVCVVTRSLIEKGSYSEEDHRSQFLRSFGPCGTFVGYADRPTLALVSKMLQLGDAIVDPSGSDDDQLPALTSVPALFSCYQSPDFDIGQLQLSLKRSVLTTTTNQDALDGARTLMRCLLMLQEGKSLEVALSSAIDESTGELAELLQAALALPDHDPIAAANHFGMPCHIRQGLPLSWHILQHAQDLESAIRANIVSGGDSCGRAIAIGAVAGLAFGIPPTLSDRVSFPLFQVS